MPSKKEIFPLYKYTTPETAKKIIKNCSLQFSSPTVFNDPFDMKISSTIPMTEENWIKEQNKNFVDDVINLDLTQLPSRNEEDLANLERMTLMQQTFKKASPEKKKQIEEILVNRPFEGELLERLTNLKNINEKFTSELCNLIKRSVVLCMAGKKDNRLMWSHYAKSYEGAVFAFKPNFEKDSCFALMEPVTYSEERYFPYRNPAELLQSKLSEDHMLQEFIKMVSTKDKEWSYEEEYRFCIPMILKNDEKL